MVGSTIPRVSATVILAKPAFQQVLDNLNDSGFQLDRPTVREGAVDSRRHRNISELPVGWVLEQRAGSSHLLRTQSTDYFGCTVGPHSWKRFLFPPRFDLLTAHRTATAGRFNLLRMILLRLPSSAYGRATCMRSQSRMKCSSTGVLAIRTMRTGAGGYSSLLSTATQPHLHASARR